jgi:hypothetical protein
VACGRLFAHWVFYSFSSDNSRRVIEDMPDTRMRFSPGYIFVDSKNPGSPINADVATFYSMN